MNFIKFIIFLIGWGLLFWNIIILILGMPAVVFTKLFDHSFNKTERIKLVSMLAIFFAFLFGTFLPCVTYGGGIGFIVTAFLDKAIYPLPYLIIGGITSYYIVAPSGETNIFGRILSLLTFFIFILKPGIINSSLVKGTLLSFSWLFHVSVWVGVCFIVLGVIFLGIQKFKDRQNPKREHYRGLNKKSRMLAIFGIGTYVLSVFASATNSEGASQVPGVLIAISAIASLAFYIMAIIRLWKNKRLASIAFAFSSAILFTLQIFETINQASYGSWIIILTNIVKVVSLVVFIWIIYVLWQEPESQADISGASSKLT